MSNSKALKLTGNEIDAIEEDFRKSLELEVYSLEEFDKLKKLCAMARQNMDSQA